MLVEINLFIELLICEKIVIDRQSKILYYIPCISHLKQHPYSINSHKFVEYQNKFIAIEA